MRLINFWLVKLPKGGNDRRAWNDHLDASRDFFSPSFFFFCRGKNFSKKKEKKKKIARLLLRADRVPRIHFVAEIFSLILIRQPRKDRVKFLVLRGQSFGLNLGLKE